LKGLKLTKQKQFYNEARLFEGQLPAFAGTSLKAVPVFAKASPRHTNGLGDWVLLDIPL